MAIRTIKLPSPNTVSASATSLISCPVGTNYRYHAIHLRIGTLATGGGAVSVLPVGASTTAGFLNDIRVKVGGKTQRLHTGAQLCKLNGLNGAAYVVQTWGTSAASKKYGQVVTIYFAEPWRKSLGQQDALALPSWLTSLLEVEIDFGALPTNGSSFILEAWAEVDTINDMSDVAKEVQKNGIVMSKVYRQNLTGGTAANSALDVVTLDRRDLYTTIVADLGNTAMPGTAANGITVATAAQFSAQLTVKANGVPVAEAPKDVAKLKHYGRGLNPEQFDLEAVLDAADDINTGLVANGLTDLQVRIDLVGDTAASAAWVLLTERMGRID